MNRAWTFVINKELSQEALDSIQKDGNEFVHRWTAHEQQLSGSFTIFKNRIIVVKVNEDVNAASGCSIDKLTRFIKETEIKYGINLMNRLLVAFKNNDKVDVVHSSEIKSLLKDGRMNENTIIYNTSIANQEELANWEQPLKDTWLKKYL